MTNPAEAVNWGEFPIGLGFPVGVTYHNGVLAILAASSLWTLAPSGVPPPDTVPARGAAPSVGLVGDQITVTWVGPDDGGDPITGYTLEQDHDGTLTTTTHTGLTTTITATSDGDYAYRFLATNSIGDGLYSPQSATVTYTTPVPATVPSRPAAPTVSLVGDQITVGWVAPDDGGDPITSYQLQQDLDGTRTNTIHTGLTTTITATVDGDYRYRVRAINGVGNSVRSLFSATVTYTAPPPPTGPTVASVVAVSVGETTVTIRVNVVDADGSVVSARYADDATFPIGSTTNRASTIQAGDSSHDFAVVGLDAATLYYVEASYDFAYDPAETEETTFTTEAAGPLSYTPGNAVNRGTLPSGLTNPRGAAYDGTQLIVIDFSGAELWTVADVASPGDAVLRGSFPSGLTAPRGITHDGTQLIVVDDTGNELWTVGDITDPGNTATTINRGSFPSGLTTPYGITHDGTQLIVVDNGGDELWTVGDITDPGNTATTINRGSFPSGLTTPQGITHDGTQLIVIDFTGAELWTVADITDPGNTATTINRGSFPSGLAFPAGITHDGIQLIVVDSDGDELWTLAPD